MYASGVPTGIMVDSKGPRWGVVLGIVFFAAGYYPIAQGMLYKLGSRAVLTFVKHTKLVQVLSALP
jgi:hypothetical protein